MKIDISVQNIVRMVNAADIRVRYGIFAGILLAVFALDYFLVLNFQVRSLARTKGEIKTVSVDIDRVGNDMQRIDQIKQGLVNSRAQLDAASQKIRWVQEVPVILEEISRTAHAFDVTIDQIKPLPESQETLISAPEGKYYALPIVIQARCGYHMFGRFLNTLESGNLFFSLRDLRMEAGQDAAKGLVVAATLKVILAEKFTSPAGGPRGPKT